MLHSPLIDESDRVGLLNGGCGVVKLHESVMDVGGVNEGDAEAVKCNELLGQLQGRSNMALRRTRDDDGVQLAHMILGLHHGSFLTSTESHVD